MAAGVVVCSYCILGRHEGCVGRETPGADCACIVCAEVQAETVNSFVRSGMSRAVAESMARHFWPESEDETPPGTIEVTAPAEPRPLAGSKLAPGHVGRVEVTMPAPVPKKPD